MGREFELKYRANPEKLRLIRENFEDFTPITMETAYYDTPGGAFGAKRWMLRRRLENGRSVCTLKTPLPDGSRGEWETACGSIERGIKELCKLGAPQELAQLACAGLVEVCAARFTRLAAVMELTDCTVELALDQGVFLGGGKEQPFAELEVELKDGSEEGAIAFAQGLAREFGLAPETKSKVQRALAMAGR